MLSPGTSTLPAHEACLAVLAAGAVLTILVGLLRRRRAFLVEIPGPLFLLAAVAFLLPPERGWLRPAVVPWLPVVALLLLLGWRRQAPLEGPPATAPSSWQGRLSAGFLLLGLVLAAVLVLPSLADRTDSLFVWEATVVSGFGSGGGFAAALREGLSPWQFLRDHLLWDEGLLSAGHTSLLYGAPTYALFHLVGASSFTLRIASALAVLVAMPVLCLAVRRPLGTTAAAAASLVLGLNACFLFYAGYGSSPAGTALAVLLAFGAVAALLRETAPSFGKGLVAGLLLSLATFQYAPSRIVVLVLISVVVLATLVDRFRSGAPNRWRGLVGLLLVVGLTAGWQHHLGTTGKFLHARGEQFFGFVDQPRRIDSLFGPDILGRPLTDGPLTPSEKRLLFVRVVERNAVALLDMLRPDVHEAIEIGNSGVRGLPRRLQLAPLLPFLLLGVARALPITFGWFGFSLFAWGLGSLPPLLLTSRVDSHRALLLVIPLAIATGIGLREAGRGMRRAGVPRLAVGILAFLLLLGIGWINAILLHRQSAAPRAVAPALARLVNEVDGPLILGTLLNHGDMAWAHLARFDREIADPRAATTILDDHRLGRLSDQGPGLAPGEVHGLEKSLDTATMLLGPTDRFLRLADLLKSRGARVERISEDALSVFRIDRRSAPVPAGELPPPPPPPPTPTPISLSEGPRQSLVPMAPLSVFHGFETHRVNRSWAGNPIELAGQEFGLGFGVHAPTTLEFAVPPEAAFFEAVIGLSEKARTCPQALVTFEVRAGDGTVLFDSGLVDSASAPRLVRVPVRGQSSLALVVTEGGNGRDCDHAVWAEPAFLPDPADTDGPAVVPPVDTR